MTGTVPELRRRSSCRRVVVGVSGSPGSTAALRTAVAEAGRTGAVVVAVLAWSPPPVTGRGHWGVPVLAALDAGLDAAAERLRGTIDGAFAVGLSRVRLSSFVVRGEAGEVLVRMVGEPEDLLVVGAGAEGLIWRGLRPSVASHCVRRSGCPVLVVPRPAPR
ncbi:universal stress protein [Kitasatospora sp. NPDC001664]